MNPADELQIVTVPRELYYHEVAYVRGLEAEIERLQAENNKLRLDRVGVAIAMTQRDAARAEALEEAAKVAENGCLVPPDGGSPTEDERIMCSSIAAAIRALKEDSP